MSTADQLYDEAIDLQQAGKLDEAISKLEELIVSFPDYALAHAGLSVFYSKTGRSAEAVEHARKVCEFDPEDPFSYMALSMICQRAGLVPEAEAAMNEALHRQWEAKQKKDEG